MKPPQKGEFYTEEDWNTTSTAEKGAYFVSKVRFRGIASTSTHAKAKAHGLDVINAMFQRYRTGVLPPAVIANVLLCENSLMRQHNCFRLQEPHNACGPVC